MTKQEIEKRTKYWQRVFGLTTWNISVCFPDKPKESPKAGESVDANVEVNTQYQFATINYFLPNVNKVEDSTIIHELVHILTAELVGFAGGKMKKKDEQEWLLYYKEKTVTQIERVMSRIYKREL